MPREYTAMRDSMKERGMSDTEAKRMAAGNFFNKQQVNSNERYKNRFG